MSASKFVYIIYIKTTPEKLWDALTKPEFTRKYWVGTHQESTFEPGADWKLMIPDGRVGDMGKILEVDRPHKLVLSWRNEFRPEISKEGFSRCTYELAPMGEVVKLTVLHESALPESKLIEAVSTGWPMILSSLKTMLETGEAFPGSGEWPKNM
jgi:uncharacterized protein YndB with AHSA1/START domain